MFVRHILWFILYKAYRKKCFTSASIARYGKAYFLSISTLKNREFEPVYSIFAIWIKIWKTRQRQNQRIVHDHKLNLNIKRYRFLTLSIATAACIIGIDAFAITEPKIAASRNVHVPDYKVNSFVFSLWQKPFHSHYFYFSISFWSSFFLTSNLINTNFQKTGPE